MNKFCGFLYVVLMIWEGIYYCQGSVGICITNCVQCKKMFGPYFEGKACGDACVLSDGTIALDCNKPETFGTFLKRFY